MYGEKFWYWEIGAVPNQFKRHVCLCTENTQPGFDYKLGLPVCEKCGKLFRHFIKECENCKRLFLKDFHAPNFDIVHPLCWDCLEPSMSPPQGTPWGIVPILLEHGIVPPQLIKKVDITDFSFDFE